MRIWMWEARFLFLYNMHYNLFYIEMSADLELQIVFTLLRNPDQEFQP